MVAYGGIVWQKKMGERVSDDSFVDGFWKRELLRSMLSILENTVKPGINDSSFVK